MHAYYMSIMEFRETAKEKGAGKEEQQAYENALEFSKFFYFLRSPVLVFRTEYPRIKKFRIGYFIKKVCQTFFHLVLFIKLM